jgi:hypothetical protein
VRQTTGLGHRSDFIDDHRAHAAHDLPAPARL